MPRYIIKRDGTRKPFDSTRIELAVEKAFRASGEAREPSAAAFRITRKVLEWLEEEEKEEVHLEHVQDLVIKALHALGYHQTEIRYAIYRYMRQQARVSRAGLLDVNDVIESYLKDYDWRVWENANIGFGFGGLLLHSAGTMIANYVLNYIYPQEIAEAHRNGFFHIHDLSFGVCGYCAGWSLRQLLLEGFGGVRGKVKADPPKHFGSALLQMVNFLGTLQNEWAGAQAFNEVDVLLAPFVRRDKLSYKEVKQYIQQFVFNLNVTSRWGGQCVDEKTECLTPQGWKKYYELKEGDPIVTFDLKEQRFKIDKILKLNVYNYRGKLLRFKNSIVDFLVTPNHRIVRRLFNAPDGPRYVLEEAEKVTSKTPVDIPLVAEITRQDQLKLCDAKISVTSIKQIEKVDHTGKVWCPTTKTATFIARRNYKVFITGNSPFTNITLSFGIPEHMKREPVVLEGKITDKTYAEYHKEVEMINRAFLEVMLDGDADNKLFPFPIPTYNITGNFDWDHKNTKLLFEMTARYGVPYFQNFINSDLNPADVRSMCCRLSMNLKELRKKTGGLFGSGDSTGSIGVVTLNMPRLAYISRRNIEMFFKLIDRYMELARDSLEIKRKMLERNLEKGLFPFTARYLAGYKTFFSTIGLLGMNEACLNLIGKDIASEEGQKLAISVLTFMREKLKKFQQQTGNLYNLEATPAEGTSYRLAKTDLKEFPDIITAGTPESPYYTNSTQLPVNYTDDLFFALKHQEPLQVLYTGGTVFHCFLGEAMPDGKSCMMLVRRILSNFRLPYLSITPTFSICPSHGYIKGEHHSCPQCGKECEVYSRIVGYYRPVNNWNRGKQQEFKERKTFKIN